jgi:ABC-type antimicrobial peptide transport system permease subunit
MDSFYFAWKSYRRRGWGVLLLIIPAALLFGLVTLLLVAEEGFAVKVDKDDLRFLRAGSPLGRPNLYFTQAEYQRIAKFEHVEEMGLTLPDVGETKETGPHPPAQMEATTSSYLRIWHSNHKIESSVLDEWDTVKNGALVSTALARRKGWHVGDNIEVPANNGGVAKLRITGFNDIAREKIHIHLDYITSLGMQPVSWVVWMRIDDPRNNDAVQRAITEMLPGRPIEFYTMVDSKSIIRGNRDVLLLFAFRLAGYLSAMLLVAVSLMVLSISVEERAKELATLRVLGYRRLKVASIIMVESLLNLLPGAILAGLIVYFSFRGVGIPFTGQFKPLVTWTPILMTWAGALVIGIGAAIPPAVPVLTLDVLGTLRGD